MAHPSVTKLLAIDNMEVERFEINGNSAHIYLKRRRDYFCCAQCGQLLFIAYDCWDVIVRDLLVWGKDTYLHFKKYRIKCNCNNKLQVEYLPWLYDNERITMRLAYEIYRRCEKTTVSDVAKHLISTGIRSKGLTKS